jgi:hypothetical protein
MMPVALHRSGTPIDSIFAIHGSDENDLSAAFAFALRSSPALLSAVVHDIEPTISGTRGDTSVHIQTVRKTLGITDIEIRLGGKAIKGLTDIEIRLGGKAIKGPDIEIRLGGKAIKGLGVRLVS